MEVIRDIAAVLACVLSAITLITLLAKGGYKVFQGAFSKGTKDLHESDTTQNTEIANLNKSITDMKTSIGNLESKLEAVELYLFCVQLHGRFFCDTIKNIYYNYLDKRELPTFEQKTLIKTYDLYKNKFKVDNTYATTLYDEMINHWKVVSNANDPIEPED